MQENKDTKQEETPHKEGTVRDTDRDVSSWDAAKLIHPDYTRSKEAWKQYLEGKLTATELAEYLGEYAEKPKEVDFFEGEVI